MLKHCICSQVVIYTFTISLSNRFIESTDNHTELKKKKKKVSHIETTTPTKSNTTLFHIQMLLCLMDNWTKYKQSIKLQMP